MEMDILVCNTNLAVEYVSTMILQQPPKQFVIITDLKNVEHFFSILEIPSGGVIRFKANFSLKEIFSIKKEKEKIKKFLKEGNINKIHIFHQAFGGLFNWLCFYANKSNIPIEYHRVLDDLQCPKASFSLNFLKLKLLYLLFYKTNVNILDRGNKCLVPKLSKEFYLKNKISEIKICIDKKLTSIIGKKITEKMNFPVSKSAILILTGSILSTNQITPKEYSKKISALINKLGVNNIICKCHPRFDDEIPEERACVHIPSFIPMEFLISQYQVCIGYNSTLLKTFALENKTAISLLNYLEPISKDRKKQWFIYFNSSKIQYPSNIDEITKIIGEQKCK